MNAEIATLDLSIRRKSIIGYSIGLALYVLIVIVLYPSFKDAANLDSLTTDSPGVAALFGISGSITSPTGWLSANIYANFFPLILLLLTIGYGAWAIAGQEAEGQLELVLSLPFARARIARQKIAALVSQAVVVSAVVFLCVSIGPAFDLSVDYANTATATLGVTLLGIAFGMLALAIGATTGERGTALAIAATVASASYLVNAMAPVVDWLEPAKYASLFFWAVGDGQLERGLAPDAFLVLASVSLVLAAVAVHQFRRHDVS